ncbi:hypothetical protein [Jiangella asiatica]|uniref:Uncharacterized protein n=1 Tax=Jiangella asiatica TaxID=2530372 RepID=A0A4R5DXD1_9ACTN|nr:hypothetical protein [Jiangella asiatica]TDE15753.1 hypothetical protein E1269_00100 [Jiangella asiatica]
MTARTTVLIVLPLALAVAGCGGARSDDVAVVADSVTAARSAGQVADRQPAELVLPLDEYAFSEAEDEVLAAAAEAAVRDCFEARGFDAADADPLPFGSAGGAAADAVDAADAADKHERRYAVADPEVAARHGYHPPDTTDVRQEFYESHTEAELTALVGTQDGADDGCLHEADEVTAVGNEATLREGELLVSEVQADAWHGAMADPRVQDAFAAWSACMAAAGYRYDAPMEANDDPAWWSTDVAGADEIATAVADVACKDSTGLIAVWSAVEAEYQSELIAQNQDGFDAYRALLDDQVAHARAAAR